MARKIQSICKDLKISSRALRYYEELGLIQGVIENKSRLFDDKEIEKIKLIILFRQLNLSLSDIKEIINNLEHQYINSLIEKSIFQSKKEIHKHSINVKILEKFLKSFPLMTNEEEIKNHLINSLYNDYVNAEDNVLELQVQKRRRIVADFIDNVKKNQFDLVVDYLNDKINIQLIKDIFITEYKLHQQNNISFIINSEYSCFNNSLTVKMDLDALEMTQKFIFDANDKISGLWLVEIKEKIVKN